MTVPIGPVPVFNCVVDIAPAGPDGAVVARVMNLAGIETTGRSEREALAAAVAAFKAEVSRLHSAGGNIPWIAEQPPARGASRRLIAVHL
jgi:hypothetical protein